MNEKGCFSNEDLLIFLSQLVVSFGLHRPFESPSARENFSRGNLTKVILEIKEHMRVTCRLKALYVQGDIHTYLANAAFLPKVIQEKAREFLKSGRFATMATLMPWPLPIYGTRAFECLECVVAINAPHFSSHSYETFAAGISHELAHIILDCIRHPLQKMETAVDLLTMVLGFADIALAGNFYHEGEEGGLTLAQTKLAHAEIKRLL
ncbi:MAG: hypothetical protein WC726_04235 [Parcubacteria group bacterium]